MEGLFRTINQTNSYSGKSTMLIKVFEYRVVESDGYEKVRGELFSTANN